MEEKNCELLFEYLRSILYDSEIKTLDVTVLDEPYRKLGLGMRFLHKAVEEMMVYSENLSRGNLSAKFPERDNFLCANLKNLHANLNHLTWQAKQVAAGDYSQHVSYLGEFSDSFNLMIHQLEERQNLVKDEKEKLGQRAETIEAYNRLLMEIMRKRNEWAFIVDKEKQEIVYCNRHDWEQEDDTHCKNCKSRLAFNQAVGKRQFQSQTVWEYEGADGRVYRITSFPGEWRERDSFIHMAEDITKEKQEAQKLEDIAYHDPVTGIYNRQYFDEYMSGILQTKKKVTLCYLDMDGLKYVNDNYGHTEGDYYIRSFTGTIQRSIRKEDIFARIGGDEFCLILADLCMDAALKKMDTSRELLKHSCGRSYPMSFSYGIYEIPGEANTLSLEEILSEADRLMYKYKRSHREENNKERERLAKLYGIPVENREKDPQQRN